METTTNSKRRSSILKANPTVGPFNVDSELTGTQTSVRRRVSFRSMRTVKEYSECIDLSKSPVDEPLKSQDTGSSDGTSSVHFGIFSSCSRGRTDDVFSSTTTEEISVDDETGNVLHFSDTSTPRHPARNSNEMRKFLGSESPIQDISTNERTLSPSTTKKLFGPYSEADDHCECMDISSASSKTLHLHESDRESVYMEDISMNMSVSPQTTAISNWGEDEAATASIFAIPTKSVEKNSSQTKETPQSISDENLEVADSAKLIGLTNIQNLSGLEISRRNSPIGDFIGGRSEPSSRADDTLGECAQDSLTVHETETNVIDGHAFEAEKNVDRATSMIESVYEVEKLPSLFLDEVKSDNRSSSIISNQEVSVDDVKKERTASARKVPYITNPEYPSPVAIITKKRRKESHFKQDNPRCSPSIAAIYSTNKPAVTENTGASERNANGSNQLMLTPVVLDGRCAEGQLAAKHCDISTSEVLLNCRRRIRHNRDGLANVSSLSEASSFIIQSDSLVPHRKIHSACDRSADRHELSSYLSSPLHNTVSGTRCVPNVPTSGTLPSTCRFNDMDFDLNMSSAYYINAGIADSEQLLSIKRHAFRTLCEGMKDANETLQNMLTKNIDRLKQNNPKMAEALIKLNPKKLSREERKIFETCRISTQTCWYEFRWDIANAAYLKINEIIKANGPKVEEKKTLIGKLETGKHLLREEDKLKKRLEFLTSISLKDLRLPSDIRAQISSVYEDAHVNEMTVILEKMAKIRRLCEESKSNMNDLSTFVEQAEGRWMKRQENGLYHKKVEELRSRLRKVLDN
ncbi:hypothetical protein AB6A40_001902 [Gnathostoma spinigerum]|uniref:Uncharacterized protein n=1 Tax=Gnathostoma spinigerum TaxID=75299 RepID=A0ABD6EEB0_9BILA